MALISKLLCLSIVLATGSMSAGIFYVAPTGEINAEGTVANPLSCTSLSAFVKENGGGHTFIFKSGYYRGITLNEQYVGSCKNPTILKSDEKYGAVIYGIDGAGLEIRCSWTIIDGFRITGGTAGIVNYSDMVHIKNCWIHNNSGQGIGSFGANNIILEGNLIEFNGQHPQFHHGIYMDGHKQIITRNIVRYNSGFGIHLYSQIAESAVTNNLIHDNHQAGLLVCSEPNSLGNRILHNTIVSNGAGIWIQNPDGNIIANNVVVKNGKGAMKEQISAYASDTLSGAYIKGNFCNPQLKNFINENYTGDEAFVDSFKNNFMLSRKSQAIGKTDKNQLLNTDLLGQSRNLEFPVPGCFSYIPELENEVMDRTDWYQDWPYYFKGKSNGEPDLWNLKTRTRGHAR